MNASSILQLIASHHVRPGNIGARYHPEKDKFSFLCLGWYIIKKFKTLR